MRAAWIRRRKGSCRRSGRRVEPARRTIVFLASPRIAPDKQICKARSRRESAVWRDAWRSEKAIVRRRTAIRSCAAPCVPGRWHRAEQQICKARSRRRSCATEWRTCTPNSVPHSDPVTYRGSECPTVSRELQRKRAPFVRIAFVPSVQLSEEAAMDGSSGGFRKEPLPTTKPIRIEFERLSERQRPARPQLRRPPSTGARTLRVFSSGPGASCVLQRKRRAAYGAGYRCAATCVWPTAKACACCCRAS